MKTLSPTYHRGRSEVAALKKGTAPVETGSLVFEFGSVAPTPEQLARLALGLRNHFPRRRFFIESVDGELRVFAKDSDPRMVALMRAFCAGFAASL